MSAAQGIVNAGMYTAETTYDGGQVSAAGVALSFTTGAVVSAGSVALAGRASQALGKLSGVLKNGSSQTVSVAESAVDGAENAIKGGSGFKFKYEHNPSDNPKVLQDAVEDSNAIYGYRPNKDGSLSSFADAEWDNPIAVEGYRQDRKAYHNRNEGAAQELVSSMSSEGSSTEDIARAVNEYRNQSRINAYIDANGNMKNVDGYNAELSRAQKNSYESLIKRGKTPEQIIKSATKGNPAMDACTGLYDIYYHTY